MSRAQTIHQAISVHGIGLHTGLPARVDIRPCRQPGFRFLRGDVDIPAQPEFVTDTRRCTTLGRDGAEVRTVEHLLAALWLAGVDAAEIHVDGPELPALDGAAGAWFAAIQQAGLCPLAAEAPVLRLPAAEWHADGESIFFLAPASEPVLYAAIAVPETVAERMAAGGPVMREEIRTQVLRARTYGLEREVEALRAAGLARGGSLENAVVLTRDGYLNPHVWPCEPAWHKVLDLAGDLALAGVRLQGQVMAFRGSHRTHVALAAQLRALAAGGASSEPIYTMG